MRLWSIHPMYLDSKGLVALWREGLLAQKVLQGQTRGYKNHPQLNRFKATANPVGAIADYLRAVADEADSRGYNFNRDKIADKSLGYILTITNGQVQYEFKHLLGKLWDRDRDKYDVVNDCELIAWHPLFRAVDGDIANWEVV